MNFDDARFGRLAADFGGEIDLVMRGADAGGNLNHEVDRVGTGVVEEKIDGSRDDTEFRSLPPGVGEGNASTEFIGNENSGAIGDINPKAEPSITSHQGIAIWHWKFVTSENLSHGISVDLYSTGKWHPSKLGAVKGGSVDGC